MWALGIQTQVFAPAWQGLYLPSHLPCCHVQYSSPICKDSEMSPTVSSAPLPSFPLAVPQPSLISHCATFQATRILCDFICYLFYTTVSFYYIHRWLIQKHKFLKTYIEKKAFHNLYISKYMIYTHLCICVYLCVCVYMRMCLSIDTEKKPIGVCWINLPMKMQSRRIK